MRSSENKGHSPIEEGEDSEELGGESLLDALYEKETEEAMGRSASIAGMLYKMDPVDLSLVARKANELHSLKTSKPFEDLSQKELVDAIWRASEVVYRQDKGKYAELTRIISKPILDRLLEKPSSVQ